MNLIIWLVVGGLIGWVASLIMKTDAQQGLLLNVIVGIVGALLGGWLLSPLVGAGTVNQGDFSLMGLLVSLGGAILLLFVVNSDSPRYRRPQGLKVRSSCYLVTTRSGTTAWSPLSGSSALRQPPGTAATLLAGEPAARQSDSQAQDAY
jgi:uncharacterized membrane protein YeaQ/YmgE (transglycosylase-associated protein family)